MAKGPMALLTLLRVRKKANNIRRWSGKAVRALAVQIPIGIYASSTDLQQSGSTGQCSLTALGPMLISLSSANETIPLVQAIVKGNLTVMRQLNEYSRQCSRPVLA